MKIDLTIEQADNGMVVRSDEDVKVIENTYSADFTDNNVITMIF